MRRGERLRGSARGTLLGERANLSFRGGTLPDMLGKRALPVELDLATAFAQLRIEGTLARPGAKDDTDLAFDFQARRSGDLARWLGVAPESNLPLALRGRARIATDAWHLDATTLKLGRSELTIDGHRPRLGERPVTVAAVRSPLIDVPELATLRDGAPVRAESQARASMCPILPYAVDFGDADVDVAVSAWPSAAPSSWTSASRPASARDACCRQRSKARSQARRSRGRSRSICAARCPRRGSICPPARSTSARCCGSWASPRTSMVARTRCTSRCSDTAIPCASSPGTRLSRRA